MIPLFFQVHLALNAECKEGDGSRTDHAHAGMVDWALVLLWQEFNHHGKRIHLTLGEGHDHIVQCSDGDDGEEKPVEKGVDCNIHVVFFTVPKEKGLAFTCGKGTLGTGLFKKLQIGSHSGCFVMSMTSN